MALSSAPLCERWPGRTVSTSPHDRDAREHDVLVAQRRVAADDQPSKAGVSYRRVSLTTLTLADPGRSNPLGRPPGLSAPRESRRACGRAREQQGGDLITQERAGPIATNLRLSLALARDIGRCALALPAHLEDAIPRANGERACRNRGRRDRWRRAGRPQYRRLAPGTRRLRSRCLATRRRAERRPCFSRRGRKIVECRAAGPRCRTPMNTSGASTVTVPPNIAPPISASTPCCNGRSPSGSAERLRASPSHRASCSVTVSNRCAVARARRGPGERELRGHVPGRDSVTSRAGFPTFEQVVGQEGDVRTHARSCRCDPGLVTAGYGAGRRRVLLARHGSADDRPHERDERRATSAFTGMLVPPVRSESSSATPDARQQIVRDAARAARLGESRQLSCTLLIPRPELRDEPL